jgi:hypothetical protein
MADIWDELYLQHGKGQTQQPSGGGDVWDNLYQQHGVKPGPRIIPVDDQPSTPGERKFAQDLQGYVDRKTLAEAPAASNPVYAGVSSAANTALFNLPRNALAGISSVTSGKPFSEEYARLKGIDDAAARQHPVASNVGMVAGAIGIGAGLPVRAATGGARALLGAGTGAAIGGLSELADTKDAEKALQSAAIGGAIGGVAAPVAEKLVGGAVNAAGKAFQKKPAIPSTEELKTASQSAYALADQAGLVVKPQGVQALSADVKQMLANEGYHPSLQGKIAPVLEELDNLASGNVTLKGLDVLRKMTSAARMDADPSTRRLGAMTIEKIDDFLNNLSPADVLMGDAKNGVSALKEARSLWSSYRKADMVDEALKMAEMRAQSTYAGGNLENAIRQEFRKILQNKKKSAAFNDAEKAALARIITGNGGQGTLRLLGKLAPQGAITTAMNLAAAGSTGGASAVGTAAAQGAKMLSEGMTKQNVDRLSATIRARGGKITRDDILNAQAGDRLRNFFSSIGVDLERLRNNEGE